MNLDEYSHPAIEDRRIAAWLGMENTLNDGSPSGFKARLPSPYDAGSLKSGFELPFVPIPNCDVLCYGEVPASLRLDGRTLVPVHPLAWTSGFPEGTVRHLAIPTASLRTVYVPDLAIFVKLNFGGIIGRYTREYDLVKWIAAIENSNELQERLRLDRPAYEFQVLDESSGIFVTSPTYGSFGVGMRKATVVGHESRSLHTIPSFSLFASRDGRDSLGSEIVRNLGGSEEDALRALLRPLIDAYFGTALGMGLFPEMNAQNVLVNFDEGMDRVQVVLRDTGDFFKDFTIRKRNGQHTRFVDYKIVEKDLVEDFYQRRSFAFDFKLGDYIVIPLIRRFSDELGLDEKALIEGCKEHVRETKGTSDYFDSPDHWYRFPKVMDADRDYYEKVPSPSIR